MPANPVLMSVRPFKIAVSDDVLNDVRARLKRTRWPLDIANDDWSYGANATYLQEMVDYWLNTYDWRSHEEAMNRLHHFQTEINDVPIHFVHEKGNGPNPIPLIMSHGWPWTFWDLQKVIGRLTDPEAHGGDPADAFDVVVPSLPGFGFSTPLTVAGVNYWRTAEIWHALMTEKLGYKKFAAQGGDFGSFVTTQLGHKYFEDVIGVHVHLVGPLGMISGNAPPADMYGPGEEGWFDQNQRFFATESAYAYVQATKPQSLAYGMNDSPVALLAWLVEKRRTWGDCRGNVESRFSKDDLITNAMIYWVTESFGSAARFYAEAKRHPWTPAHNKTPVVQAPTGIAVMATDMVKLPRRWAENYYNLKRWTVVPDAGHFAPMEAPGPLVEEIRAFFRPLRQG
jgi:pimeloyl-ACP methyl ester carboxylesterase